jgi:hypothetical protein
LGDILDRGGRGRPPSEKTWGQAGNFAEIIPWGAPSIPLGSALGYNDPT